MSFAPSPLRSNTVLVERRVTGPVDPLGLTGDPTGEGVPTAMTVLSGLPCGISPLDALSSQIDLKYEIEGQVYVATNELFCDGLEPIDFYPASGGQIVTQNGIPYVVAGNQLGAYPDIEPGDRLTDENGVMYLVLSVTRYYDVLANLQARIAQGRAWQT